MILWVYLIMDCHQVVSMEESESLVVDDKTKSDCQGKGGVVRNVDVVYWGS